MEMDQNSYTLYPLSRIPRMNSSVNVGMQIESQWWGVPVPPRHTFSVCGQLPPFLGVIAAHGPMLIWEELQIPQSHQGLAQKAWKLLI